MFDVNAIRKDFPILSREVNGKPLVYLDSAATSQTPNQVIDVIVDYYKRYNANVHRGIHSLSEEATAAFEDTRNLIKDFIKADNTKEIIFTAGTTSAINLIAYSWGRANINAGDEIVLTPMEHHSNLVPWQMLAAEKDAKLLFFEMTDDGQIDMQSAKERIGPRTKLVAITHMSNVLGTINPIAEIAKIAHAQGALLLVDGAQSVPHMPVSVKDLQCDFLAFSLHKMLGPTGVGVLWAKREILEAMPPFLGGGSMISVVKRTSFTPNELPFKFEAGTPNIADVIASGAAINYLNKIGMHNIREHEIELGKYAMQKFAEFAQYKNGNGANSNKANGNKESIDELVLYGPRDVNKRGGVFSFTFADIHPHDIGQILSDQALLFVLVIIAVSRLCVN